MTPTKIKVGDFYVYHKYKSDPEVENFAKQVINVQYKGFLPYKVWVKSYYGSLLDLDYDYFSSHFLWYRKSKPYTSRLIINTGEKLVEECEKPPSFDIPPVPNAALAIILHFTQMVVVIVLAVGILFGLGFSISWVLGKLIHWMGT